MPIRLKTISLAELEVFHALLTDPLVAENSSSIPKDASLEFARERLVSRARDERLLGSVFQRGIYDGNTLVGSGVLLTSPKDEWEIGYFVGAAYRGKGYATGAAKALVKLAQQLAPNCIITARYGKDNPASGRVLQKLGFVTVGEEMVPSVARNMAYNSIKMQLPHTPLEDGIALSPLQNREDIEWVYGLNADREALLMAGIMGDLLDKESFMRAVEADVTNDESGAFLYLITQHGKRAGYIDLSPISSGEMVLGYWVDRAFWGQGVASRAVAKLLMELPQKLREKPLFARVLDGNEASIRLLEKLGFLATNRNSYFSKLHNADVQQIIFRR